MKYVMHNFAFVPVLCLFFCNNKYTHNVFLKPNTTYVLLKY